MSGSTAGRVAQTQIFFQNGTSASPTPVSDLAPLPVTNAGFPFPTSSTLCANASTSVATVLATELLPAPGAGLRWYITSVVVSNSGTVSSSLPIQADPTGTPVLLIALENPAGGGSNPCNFYPVPIQAPVNKAVGFTPAASSNAQGVTIAGFKAP